MIIFMQKVFTSVSELCRDPGLVPKVNLRSEDVLAFKSAAARTGKSAADRANHRMGFLHMALYPQSVVPQ